MQKINFEDGQLVKKGYVEIDGTQYPTEEAEYDGATPLSAHILNKMQDNIEEAIDNIDLTDYYNKSEVDTKLDNIQALPTGGTTGQVLTKNSETDGDATWKDSTGGDNLPIGTIVDYDGDTVPDGYEEADSMNINNGVVLWENPDATVEFIAQTINLSSSNYDYVEISFARRIIDDVGNKIRIEKAEKNTSGHTESEYLTTGSSVNIASRLFNISDNTISFENNLLQQTGSSRAINNNYNVPIKVIGYKNKISIALEQESVYSTEEVVIGKWLGKPLYRRIVNVGQLQSTASGKFIDCNYDITICKCVKLYGYAYSNSGQTIPLPYSDCNNVSSSIMLSLQDDGKIRIFVGTDRSMYTECYVVLEYTKTTDTEEV